MVQMTVTNNISVLHSLLYNLFEIFIFWKISKISKNIINIKNIMIFLVFSIFLIFSKISWYFPTLFLRLRRIDINASRHIRILPPTVIPAAGRVVFWARQWCACVSVRSSVGPSVAQNGPIYHFVQVKTKIFQFLRPVCILRHRFSC